MILKILKERPVCYCFYICFIYLTSVIVLGDKMFQKLFMPTLRLFFSCLRKHRKLVCISPCMILYLYLICIGSQIRWVLHILKLFKKWHHTLCILVQRALWLSIRSEISIY